MAKPVTYCKVEECDKPCRGQGYCGLHYARLRRNGDVDIVTKSWGQGRKSHPLYNTWCGMRNRCRNRKSYVVKGITVCERWSDVDRGFWNFVEDMGEKPDDRTLSDGRSVWSVDRIDNQKGYSPDNCRWADSTQQANNRGYKYCPNCSYALS